MWWLFVETSDLSPFRVNRRLRLVVLLLAIANAVSWSILVRGRTAYRDLRLLIIERCG